MLPLLIEKEIRDILSSTKFAVTFGVGSLLILLAFYTGARNYQLSLQRYHAAVRENMRQLEGMTDWGQINNYRVFLPPTPLAALVSGISNDVGRTVDMRGGSDTAPYDSFFGNDPVYAAFRFLDLDFIIQVLLSLFAILFAFDAITGEKERGTLRLNFANALPRKTFILGKLIGFMGGFILPLLLPCLLGCLLMRSMGVILQWDELFRLLCILVTGAMYLAVFLLLAMLFSARCVNSSTAFLYSLGIWVLVVMIVPRLSVSAAEMVVQVPALEQIYARKAKLSTQLWEEDRAAMAQFRGTPTTDVQALMKEFSTFMDKRAQNRQYKLNELSKQLFEVRENAQRLQQNIAFTLGAISPATAFSLAVTQLAGTSLDLEKQFASGVASYRAAFDEFMYQKTGTRMSGGVRIQISTGDDEQKKLINPAEMPEFIYREPQLAQVAAPVLIKIGLLFIMGAALFGAAVYSFTKYDLR